MSHDKVTDLSYLNHTMGGNKKLVKEIMELFLKQVPEEISNLTKSIENIDYDVIRKLAYSLKSSASIMGISTVTDLLHQMQDLCKNVGSIEKINEINNEVHFIFTAAMREVEMELIKYK